MMAGSRGALLLWLGWALFWLGLYWAGIEVQTWAFSKDLGPKPPEAEVLEPLHFWFPAALFFMPVWWVETLLTRFVQAPFVLLLTVRIGAAAWSLLIAGFIVHLEARLFDGGHRLSTWVLVATAGALLALRLVGNHDHSAGSAVPVVSGFLLSVLVVGTYGAIAIALYVVARRRRRSAL